MQTLHRRTHAARFEMRVVLFGQGRFMTVDTLGNLFPIARPEAPPNQVRPPRRWEVGNAVNSPMLPNPVSILHVIVVRLTPVARGLRLLRSKEARLTTGHYIEVAEGALPNSHFCISTKLFV